MKFSDLKEGKKYFIQYESPDDPQRSYQGIGFLWELSPEEYPPEYAEFDLPGDNIGKGVFSADCVLYEVSDQTLVDAVRERILALEEYCQDPSVTSERCGKADKTLKRVFLELGHKL